jgi:exonuclease VII large subunit
MSDLLTRQLQTASETKHITIQETNKTEFQQSTVTDMALLYLPKKIIMTYKHSAQEYNAAADELMAAAQRMEQAMDGLLACEKDTSKKVKETVSKAKETAAKLGDALARVNRMLGPDFESRLAQVERLADALAKLADLDRGGKLQGIVKALGQ